MTKSILQIDDLWVEVEGKPVLHKIDLTINPAEIVVIMGANGSGKTSLAQVLMGSAAYVVRSTQILLDGKDLLKMSIDERARAGLFVAWQNPVNIPGVSVFGLCKSSVEARGEKIDELIDFKHKLEKLAERVGLSSEHISREANVGFSGGERKRLELLQLLLLKPKMAILDEIDSGLDTDGIKILLDVVKDLKKEGASFILITHNKQLYESEIVDQTLEMKNGRLQTRI